MNVDKLFENNKDWVKKKLHVDPDYFNRLANLQTPKYLWIGCSDSRVMANEIIGLESGELFVHRNIANVVVHTDMNCISVLHYAVKVLKVEHVLVVGHYGCGGVKAAMSNQQFGLIDNWLRNIKDVYRTHEKELNDISNEDDRFKRLCELNVKEQVFNVCATSIIQNEWHSGSKLTVHGWIYDIHDGILKDLGVSVNSKKQLNSVYHII